MLFLRQPLIFPFLCHKSATICQTDSYMVSNPKWEADLCNCVESEKIESIAPQQQQHKRGNFFWNTLQPLKFLKSIHKLYQQALRG